MLAFCSVRPEDPLAAPRRGPLLTVSGSAVALFVFCFVGAIQEGLADLRRQQEGRATP